MGFKITSPQCYVCNALIDGNGIRCQNCFKFYHSNRKCSDLHTRHCVMGKRDRHINNPSNIPNFFQK